MNHTTISPNRIITGDARRELARLPGNSVDCIVTSPPYFRLRNYQHEQQLGLERHVDDWVASLLAVTQQLHRVLKPSGSLWLNLGDTYARTEADGATGKSLVLAPERVARALVKQGWIIRNKVIWAKPNPMPTSVRDRLSCTYEVVYFAVKSPTYFFDLDAIREPHRTRTSATRQKRSPKATDITRHPAWAVPEQWRAPLTGSNGGLDSLKASGLPGHPLGKNPGDVWTIPTAGYRGAHHAVYPERLIYRPLLATCPDRVCERCGEPWRRQRHRAIGHLAVAGELRQYCACEGAGTTKGIVLDPFIGSGTTAIAAERLGRDWLGIEVNPDFAKQAEARIAAARTVTTRSQQAA